MVEVEVIAEEEADVEDEYRGRQRDPNTHAACLDDGLRYQETNRIRKSKKDLFLYIYDKLDDTLLLLDLYRSPKLL